MQSLHAVRGEELRCLPATLCPVSSWAPACYRVAVFYPKSHLTDFTIRPWLSQLWHGKCFWLSLERPWNCVRYKLQAVTPPALTYCQSMIKEWENRFQRLRSQRGGHLKAQEGTTAEGEQDNRKLSKTSSVSHPLIVQDFPYHKEDLCTASPLGWVWLGYPARS